MLYSENTRLGCIAEAREHALEAGDSYLLKKKLRDLLGYSESRYYYAYCKKVDTKVALMYRNDILKDLKRWSNAKKTRESGLVFSDSFSNLLSSTDNKALRLLYGLRRFARVSQGNYITVRTNDRHITYHPRPESQQFNENGDWKREGRQEIRLVALLSKLYGGWIVSKIQNKDLEEAAAIIKNFGSEVTMEEVSIDECYSHGGAGWVQSSCMYNKHHLLDLYRDNEDVFQGIIFKKGTEVVGRCLRVTIDDFTYYDRVYHKSSEHLNAIHDLFKEKGFMYKYVNSYSDKVRFTDGVNVKCKTLIKEVSVDLDSESLPYCDTLSYLYDIDGTMYISNEQPERSDDVEECYVLNSTCGSYETINLRGVWDDIDECYIDEEDACTIDYGRHEGRITHVDNVYYSDANGGYILR